MTKDFTVAQIKEELDALGIEYDKKAKKAELMKILEAETVDSVEEESKKYIVLHDFKDLEDKGFIYVKGDTYPRKENKNVTQDRIQQLTSSNNKIGKVLIKEQD